MYTGVSLLESSVYSVVGSAGSYLSGFINQSGRESVSDSVSASVPTPLAWMRLFKISYFLFRQ